VTCFWSILLLSQPLWAQQKPETSPSTQGKLSQELEKPRSSKGTFGVYVGSKLNTYQSAPEGIAIKTIDIQPFQKSLQKMKNTNFGLLSNVEHNFQSQNLRIPSFAEHFPQINVEAITSLINQGAISQYLVAHLRQAGDLTAQWQPYLSEIQTLISQNLHSIIDLPSVGEQIFNLVQDPTFQQTFMQTMGQLESIQLDNIPWENFYNADALQSLLEDYAQAFDLTINDGQNFLDHTTTALNNTAQMTIMQGVQSLFAHGFSITDKSVKYTDPNSPSNQFQFIYAIDDSAVQFNGTAQDGIQYGVSGNLGSYVQFHGNVSLNTNNLLQGLSQEAQSKLEDVLNLIQSAVNNEISINEFLDSLQNVSNNISEDMLPLLLAHLQRSLTTDLSITLDFGALSNSFSGSGSYQFIDIALSTLANDVGTLTFNKQNILAITQMIASNASESDIALYIWEDVAGYSVTKVGYNVARDAVNSLLARHFQGNMSVIAYGMFGDGILIQLDQSLYASKRIGKNFIATGSYNERHINNSPLLKEDGHLHLRTEVQTHSLGVAYVPTLWKNLKTKTKLNGVIQLEGYMIRPISASVLTKADTNNDQQLEVIKLYDIPLEEFEETNRPYYVPFASAGLILEQPVTNWFALSSFALVYPGPAQHGDLNHVERSIVPRVQGGVTLVVNLYAQPTRKSYR
ncbi:MAG: hypothetical protein KDD46_08240, partial [Bdellovibrionales bacterium]|nr:hypothetical protein [Bdellovibrionales bacterium]